MAQARIQAAGRPGSALLILVAIFATAAILRLPIGGPPPPEPLASVIDAWSLTVWSAAPAASMDRPLIAPRRVEARNSVLARTATLAPLHMTPLASATDASRPEVNQRRPILRTDAPIAPPQPALVSTGQTQLAGFAAPVVPVPFVEPSSPPQPFSALGTAFAKTGAALTLAFKKTGQGILAPF